MDVAQDRGFAERGRRSRMKFLLFRLENLTIEASVAMLGDMASYLGIRRRHVDFLTVISSGCRTH